MEIVSPLSGESSTKSGLDDLATSAEQLMLNPPANGLGLVHASGEKHLIDMPTFPTLLHFLGWMTTRRIPPAELSDSVHGLTVLDAQNSQFAASITEGSSLAGLVTGLGQLYGAGLWATNDLSLHLLNVVFEQLSTELQAARQSATHRAHLIELEDTVLDYGNSMSTLGRDDLNAISGNGAEVLIPILDPVAQFDSGVTEQHLSSVDEVIDEVNLLPPDEHVNSLLDSGMIVNPNTASSSAAGTGPVAKRRGRPKKAATPLTVSTVRRSTRNNNDGYIHPGLPDRATRRRPASVPAATPPEILQISEMQRLGIEECHIAPEELTEERLRRKRQD
jgi:hypothetical protein